MSRHTPDHVRITDVAPRDGLQNESEIVTLAAKLSLVRALIESRVDEIEVSSFVSPRWIPQLADASELFSLLKDSKPPGICFSALVPNEKGMQAALEVNRSAGFALVDKVSVFTAASESFSKRNTNASIAETIDRFKPVVALAKSTGLRVRGYVSCAIACPFEGPIAPGSVIETSARLIDLGVDEIDLGDTIGAGTPQSIRVLLESMLQGTLGPSLQTASSLTAPVGLVLHLHDTFGAAGACVREALSLGIRSFDGAVGGLGGCPYASVPGRRAPGNIDTLTLLHEISRAGLQTGVDRSALERAGGVARSILRPPSPDSTSPADSPRPERP